MGHCNCNKTTCNSCNTATKDCILRYTGETIDCIGIEKNELMETVIQTLATYACDHQEFIENPTDLTVIQNDLITLSNDLTVLEGIVSSIPLSPTTVVVEIPQGVAGVSGILGMGTVPIELLPIPAVGTYYDLEKVLLEYTHVTTAYTTAESYIQIIGVMDIFIAAFLIKGSNNRIAIADTSGNGYIDSGFNVKYANSYDLGSPITIKTEGNSDPTLGDGTLRIIITYTVRTFGA